MPPQQDTEQESKSRQSPAAPSAASQRTVTVDSLEASSSTLQDEEPPRSFSRSVRLNQLHCMTTRDDDDRYKDEGSGSLGKRPSVNVKPSGRQLLDLSTHGSICGELEDPWEMGEPLHDEDHAFGRFRNRCGRFINSHAMQWFITFLIILNALILGVLTFYFDDRKTTKKLEKVDWTLLVLFSIELSLQFVYLGPQFMRNPWLLGDGIIVIFSWAFIESPVSILRSFRIFRIFALVSRWTSLRNLVAAVGKTLPKMATIWVALVRDAICGPVGIPLVLTRRRLSFCILSPCSTQICITISLTRAIWTTITSGDSIAPF